MIHNQFCDVVHESSGHAFQATGNLIDIVYDSQLAPREWAPVVEEPVEFFGAVFDEEKTSFLKGIDIFVFPTFHREGLPCIILEAFASSTPVITTRVGVIRDVIQDGVKVVLRINSTGCVRSY